MPPQTVAVAANPQNISEAPQKNIAPVPQSNLTVVSQPISTVSKTSRTPMISHSATVYVVKSGDTLTRIAKAHGITINSLKSVNDLAGDQIIVGAKLKIPTA